MFEEIVKVPILICLEELLQIHGQIKIKQLPFGMTIKRTTGKLDLRKIMEHQDVGYALALLHPIGYCHTISRIGITSQEMIGSPLLMSS